MHPKNQMVGVKGGNFDWLKDLSTAGRKLVKRMSVRKVRYAGKRAVADETRPSDEG